MLGAWGRRERAPKRSRPVRTLEDELSRCRPSRNKTDEGSMRTPRKPANGPSDRDVQTAPEGLLGFEPRGEAHVERVRKAQCASVDEAREQGLG